MRFFTPAKPLATADDTAQLKARIKVLEDAHLAALRLIEAYAAVLQVVAKTQAQLPALVAQAEKEGTVVFLRRKA